MAKLSRSGDEAGQRKENQDELKDELARGKIQSQRKVEGAGTKVGNWEGELERLKGLYLAEGQVDDGGVAKGCCF